MKPIIFVGNMYAAPPDAKNVALICFEEKKIKN
jgi:hypothetical protein